MAFLLFLPSFVHTYLYFLFLTLEKKKNMLNWIKLDPIWREREIISECFGLFSIACIFFLSLSFTSTSEGQNSNAFPTSAFRPFSADRPCLEDRSRVQRVQRSVELGLRHILLRDNQEGLMHKVTLSGAFSPFDPWPLLRSLVAYLHHEADSQACPCSPCSSTRRWQRCVHCAACTWRSCAGSVSATRSRCTRSSPRSTRSCSPPRPSCCHGNTH